MRHDKLYGLELTVSSYYVAALLFTGILYSWSGLNEMLVATHS